MKSILIYALNYKPEPTGVGRYTADVGAYMEDRGHLVRVVTAPPHYPAWEIMAPYKAFRYVAERRGSMHIWRCPILLKRPMRGMWRLLCPFSFALTSIPLLIWEILVKRPGVIFCVEPTLFAAPLALAMAKLVGARTVLHLQDLEVDAAFAVGHLKGEIWRRAARILEGLLLRRFHLIITISERMRDQVRGKGVPQDKVMLVRNWVDLEAIRPIDGLNRYRSELGLNTSVCCALYAGSVGAKQALKVVFDAAELLKERADIVFVIAGDGPAKSALIARYGRLPNVRFLPVQPEDRMCELLNVADIHLLPQSAGIADLVLPSKLGGMLASGKPVLATADAGTELYEALQSTAIIVPAGDSKALACELETFATQGRRHKAIGDARHLVQAMSRDVCLSRLVDRVTMAA